VLAPNTSLAIRSRERLNQVVTDLLMIPFGMVASDELGSRASKTSLPELDHALEALFLDRPNESATNHHDNVSVTFSPTEITSLRLPQACELRLSEANADLLDSFAERSIEHLCVHINVVSTLA
jgi:hypothetical protein